MMLYPDEGKTRRSCKNCLRRADCMLIPPKQDEFSKKCPDYSPPIFKEWYEKKYY